MNVHEVVRETVHDASRHLRRVSRDPQEIARRERQLIAKLQTYEMGAGHSELLQPLNGRVNVIDERLVDPFRVQLFHRDTSGFFFRRELTNVQFQDESGQKIREALCIHFHNSQTEERASYIVTGDTIYALPTPQLKLGIFVANPDRAGTVVEGRRVSPSESLAVAHIAQQATSKMKQRIRGVRPDSWRMQPSIDQGMAGELLRDKEKTLWRSFQDREKATSEPPETHPLFPGARRLNYGWEWVVYLLPGDTSVAKVPRGIFPEVNKPEYLEYAQEAYLACRAEIPLFTTKTRFERRKGTNIIYQQRLDGTLVRSIRPGELPSDQRSSYRDLGKGMLTMLDIHRWMPDLQLHHSDDGSWKIWDVMNVQGLPTLYDFTSAYDEFRLNPERTDLEITINRQLWQAFIEDFS
ncbi:MAG TPA: hypothetical protein VLF93_07895 [Candidatus Saccharimonadales bacterium]|nr:hypothetical protein [Candidatus Saccharimonadales bacterium]